MSRFESGKAMPVHAEVFLKRSSLVCNLCMITKEHVYELFFNFFGALFFLFYRGSLWQNSLQNYQGYFFFARCSISMTRFQDIVCFIAYVQRFVDRFRNNNIILGLNFVFRLLCYFLRKAVNYPSSVLPKFLLASNSLAKIWSQK